MNTTRQPEPVICPFSPEQVEQVVNLWKVCELTVPWNDPYRDIELKMQVDPELFLVAVLEDSLIGTVMGGYEGHRGWIYYLAVHPDYRGKGVGKQLVRSVEDKLRQLDCPKINLMVRTTNTRVIEFYTGLGYQQSDVICLGKTLAKVDIS